MIRGHLDSIILRLVWKKIDMGIELEGNKFTYGSSILNQRSHIICCVSKAREKGIDPILLWK